MADAERLTLRFRRAATSSSSFDPTLRLAMSSESRTSPTVASMMESPSTEFIPGFMAQGGDPTGTGFHGSDKPNLKAEFSSASHKRGVASMARAQNPDSANSQFFIVTDNLPSSTVNIPSGVRSRVEWNSSNSLPVGEPATRSRQDHQGNGLERLNEVALVTGASAGLGVRIRAAACRAWQEARSRRSKKGSAGKPRPRIWNRSSSRARSFSPPVRRRIDEEFADHGEVLGTLINNAGFGLMGEFASLDFERQRQMVDLNVSTLTQLCRAAVPGMIERRSGAILNVASTAAFQPGPRMALYFATKAFVLSFSEALHEELKPAGIAVSCLVLVRPGPNLATSPGLAKVGYSTRSQWTLPGSLRPA